jgi:raffinose/stachyose/melibiose transport system permease protein
MLTSIRRNTVAYLFITPALALLAVFVLYPLVRSIQLSFYSWDGIGEPVFVGGRNFQRLAADPQFTLTLGHTLEFTLGATVGTVVIGFALAVVIANRVRGWRVFKITWFLPVMISMTVTGLLWSQLLASGTTPINALVGLLGVHDPPDWLGDATTTLPVIILVTIWQFSGFPMIVFLAAIENIPRDLEEAAIIEGAGPWQRTRYVTFPLVKPVIAIIVLLQIIFSLKVFDVVWAMTQGGPGDSSLVLGVYLYRQGFMFERFGYASAIAVVMAVVIGSFTLGYLRFVRPARHEY